MIPTTFNGQRAEYTGVDFDHQGQHFYTIRILDGPCPNILRLTTVPPGGADAYTPPPPPAPPVRLWRRVLKAMGMIVTLVSVGCGSDPLTPAPSANAWVAFTNPSTATVTVLIDDRPRFFLGPRQSSLSVPVTAGVTHQIQWQVDNRAVCPMQTISLPDGATAVYPVCAF